MPHDTHDWDLPVTSPLFTATVGVEWSAPAYSPKLDLLVVPTVDWCGIFKRDDEPRFNGGGAIVGGVISYTVNGKQYVAVVTVVVCPLTTKLHPQWRSRIQIVCARKKAEVAADQIRAISKERLGKRIDRLDAAVVAKLRHLNTEMHGE